MIWNLVATVFAGLGAAGIALTLRFLSRKKLPKWIIPAFAGLGMLGYQIYTEYTWYDFKREQLVAQAPKADVVAVQTGSMVWRPWTYLKPMVTGFTVVDRGTISASVLGGDQVVEFMLYQFEKSYVDQVSSHRQLINCASREMLEVGEQRQPSMASLQQLATDDPLYRYLCH